MTTKDFIKITSYKTIIAFLIIGLYLILSFFLMGCSTTSQIGFLNEKDRDLSNSKLIVGRRSFEDLDKTYGKPQ